MRWLDCWRSSTSHQLIVALGFSGWVMDVRDVHIHADPWRPPLTGHDGQGGDDVDQGGGQPPVEGPPSVGVLRLHTHLTHHFTWAGRQDIHLRKHIVISSTSAAQQIKKTKQKNNRSLDVFKSTSLPYSNFCRSLSYLPSPS